MQIAGFIYFRECKIYSILHVGQLLGCVVDVLYYELGGNFAHTHTLAHTGQSEMVIVERIVH